MPEDSNANPNCRKKSQEIGGFGADLPSAHRRTHAGSGTQSSADRADERGCNRTEHPRRSAQSADKDSGGDLSTSNSQPSTLIGLASRDLVVPLGAAACLWPGVSGAVALIGGAALGLIGLNARPARTARFAHTLLQVSVVALGATMPLAAIARAGLHGLGITLGSIVATLTLGWLLGRVFRVPPDTALLVSGGTAICGGSAIAALAGALRPRTHDVTIALATVFSLNALALLLFPPLGHAFGLSQRQFGWWAALAIHDTSSVVGAGLAYGSAALAIATTVKLARALWIAPLTVWFALRRRRTTAPADGAPKGAIHFPWFIVGFLACAAIVNLVPALAPAGTLLAHVAPRLLVATLFFIGAGFTREALRAVGTRPLVLGLSLWVIVATVSLLAIKAGVIG